MQSDESLPFDKILYTKSSQDEKMQPEISFTPKSKIVNDFSNYVS